MEKSGAAPTGCYKCGRPGHWSRDCPSSNTNPNPNPNPNPNSQNQYSSFNKGTASKPLAKSSEKPKKAPRTRPNLTPELLLSDNGLGYVLRHFPGAFKFRGRGHEVSDLGNLIGLYSEWHSHLLPYYSFDQFVHKVEKVGTTKRVKICIRELRERVENGATEEVMNSVDPSHYQGDTSLNHEDVQEDMLHEVYRSATEEPSQTLASDMVAGDVPSEGSSKKELPNQVPENGPIRSDIQITEEQKARMEANRQKALERAAARVRLQQAV
ncbi:uncharacterized protein LOC100240999 isoform X4 [Vitis vinifera]|uniref:uncharacterized protein LOC100240999 isoform X4 n=1 Tax=Vitis vinifera TaxID=29760 RepID=UPI00053F3095|nr:uncharacterized protein LOC100240999 isoform X4 [Vitis vinifera]